MSGTVWRPKISGLARQEPDDLQNIYVGGHVTCTHCTPLNATALTQLSRLNSEAPAHSVREGLHSSNFPAVMQQCLRVKTVLFACIHLRRDLSGTTGYEGHQGKRGTMSRAQDFCESCTLTKPQAAEGNFQECFYSSICPPCRVCCAPQAAHLCWYHCL